MCKGLLFATLAFLGFLREASAQQIQWAKLYPLAKADAIACITKDENGNMYAGGDTERNWIFVTGGIYRNKALLVKLDELGDTVFVKDIGIPGRIYSMTIDPFGMIRANIREYYSHSTLFVTLTSDGFVLQKDSIGATFPRACIIGKDSSLIVVGEMPRTGFPANTSMYFQRIQKDGTKDPIVELNPGHPNCVANRVEQLPNGNYLVSGYVGSRIASYELNEWGLFPVFKQWYQTPNLNNFNAGVVGQGSGKKTLIGGYGSPSVVGLFDSLQNNMWLKKDTGVQVSPQAMVDGSILVGYSYKPTPPTKYFQRLAADSSTIWKISFGDSLIARGYPGSVNINAFTSFPDESAVLAGHYRWDGAGTTNTKEDPIFLRIANVGTPVTSLSKPKKGSLANETLAPWPNPTGGTLYLKQHFDQAEVRLYNLAGREVGNYSIRFGEPIHISGLESGLYLYRAVIDGRAFSGKVIRQ